LSDLTEDLRFPLEIQPFKYSGVLC